MGEFHGDEDEIEADYQARKEAHEEAHADDYKYMEEWLSEPKGF